MIRLPRALAAWGGENFAAVLVGELAALGPGVLPLSALSDTGYALEDAVSLSLLEARQRDGAIDARLRVAFQQIQAGCSCGFEAEPTPAQGEIRVKILVGSAEAGISPIV